MVYTASSLALAALELFVHLDPGELTAAYVSVPLTLPPGLAIQRVELGRLPRTWRASPAPQALARIGEEWLHAAATAVLQVPSAVIPEDSVFVLNPAHPDFVAITIGADLPFQFDPRLRKT